MPVIIGICTAAKQSPSRQLMPMAYAAGLGGTITLVGTPPNIIGNAALKAAELHPFGFFEFARIGIPLTLTGILYMLFIGRYLLPKHREASPEGHGQNADENGFRGVGQAQKEAAEGETSHPHPYTVKKMALTGITLLVVVIVMAFDIKRFPLEMAAVAGAIFLVLTKCLSEKQAYRDIDWVTIFLFAGMMPVATALDRSGAGRLIADSVISIVGERPSPYALCAVLFLLSSVLTQFMSNTASAALLCPIGISIAKGIGVSPQAVVMSIVIAASCAFATPVGTPPNTLVFGAGNYRFIDYVRAGTPLVVLNLIVSVLLIPFFWPF
jgi:anion transporter